MTISFSKKYQDWADETTIYWFLVDGEYWAISDKKGETILRDCDGWVVEDDTIITELLPLLLPLYEEHKTNNTNERQPYENRGN